MKRVQNIFTRLAIMAFLSGAGGSISCSEDISECPSKVCVMAGVWRLTEVYIDGEKATGDFSQYRLALNRPEDPSSTVSDFDRTQISGTNDAGLWSVENNETILRLIPEDNSLLIEDWIIESFSPRRLVLVSNRDTGIKDGPAQIRFVLEPF